MFPLPASTPLMCSTTLLIVMSPSSFVSILEHDNTIRPYHIPPTCEAKLGNRVFFTYRITFYTSPDIPFSILPNSYMTLGPYLFFTTLVFSLFFTMTYHRHIFHETDNPLFIIMILLQNCYYNCTFFNFYFLEELPMLHNEINVW